jgi:hypothetical protein
MFQQRPSTPPTSSTASRTHPSSPSSAWPSNSVRSASQRPVGKGTDLDWTSDLWKYDASATSRSTPAVKDTSIIPSTLLPAASSQGNDSSTAANLYPSIIKSPVEDSTTSALSSSGMMSTGSGQTAFSANSPFAQQMPASGSRQVSSSQVFNYPVSEQQSVMGVAYPAYNNRMVTALSPTVANGWGYRPGQQEIWGTGLGTMAVGYGYGVSKAGNPSANNLSLDINRPFNSPTTSSRNDSSYGMGYSGNQYPQTFMGNNTYGQMGMANFNQQRAVTEGVGNRRMSSGQQGGDRFAGQASPAGGYGATPMGYTNLNSGAGEHFGGGMGMPAANYAAQNQMYGGTGGYGHGTIGQKRVNMSGVGSASVGGGGANTSGGGENRKMW